MPVLWIDIGKLIEVKNTPKKNDHGGYLNLKLRVRAENRDLSHQLRCIIIKPVMIHLTIIRIRI